MSLGERIRARRTEIKMTLPQLAASAGIAKGYLWEIEDGRASNPSAEILFKISDALGTSIADLLERETPLANNKIPQSLRDFIEETKIPESDVKMLASIKYRGKQPKTKDDWRYIYDSIRKTIS